MARRRRACGSGPNPGGGAQEDWRNPHPPRQFAKRQGLARCARTAKHRHGWWAVRQRRSPAKTVGAKVPGEFDSRTIRLPICSDRPRDRAFGIQSAKRVDRQWRNAVGHTCPAHSRTFPHGVTAAHGSLEPLVLVRNAGEGAFSAITPNGLEAACKTVGTGSTPVFASQRQQYSFRFLPLHSTR